jgi:peptide/nickel transport system permease protein
VKRRRRAGWWWPRLCLGAILFGAVFAPLLANDVPICVRIDGRWQFPAACEWVGAAVPAPDGGSWQRWCERRGAGDADFVLMPPWPHGPAGTDVGRIAARPSAEHPLGNDDTGRDVLARLIHGCATAIGVALAAVAIAGVFGVALGAAAGMAGGLVDAAVLRCIEVCQCFPVLLLVSTAACLGHSRTGVVLVMAALMWPSFARIVRGELYSLREREFVAAARGLGVGRLRLWFRHLLPQLRGPLFVATAFNVSLAVVMESAMSFFGLGPPSVSWGGLLAQGRELAHLGAWHLWVFPAAAMLATTLSVHALADRRRRAD